MEAVGPASARAPHSSTATHDAMRRRGSDLHIAHLTRVRHMPRLDRVVVVDRAGPTHRAQLVDPGLHVTGLVEGARLKDRRAAVPDPVDVEAREALGQNGTLEARGAPVAPAVERNIHALHAPAPG